MIARCFNMLLLALPGEREVECWNPVNPSSRAGLTGLPV